MSSDLEVATADTRTLAASLAPLLQSACDGRLGELYWFKADWQRGGAATAHSTYALDDGRQVPVVVKLPVGQRELKWTQRLQPEGDEDPVVPRLHRWSNAIGGHDLSWIVIERFEYGPLGLKWHDDHVLRIADAIARFHAGAASFPVDQPPRREPWDELIAEALERVRTNGLEREPEWVQALKSLRGRLDDLVAEWRARPVDQWLHGDVHVANAMSRHGAESGRVSLIDLAEVHAGHWIEDAVYLERQLWARPQRLSPHPPLRAVAAARRRLGLPVEEGYPRLGMIRRALLAATAPRFLRSEGHPQHLAACLDWLRRAMVELKAA